MEYGIIVHRTLQKETKQYLDQKYEMESINTLKSHTKYLEKILENKTDTNKWNKKEYYVNLKKIMDNNLEARVLDQIEKSSLATRFAYFAHSTNLGLKDSLKYYEKSLEINKITFKHDIIASVRSRAVNLSGLPSVYNDIGRHEEALLNFEQSLEINQGINGTDDNESIAETLNSIGTVYDNLGRYEEALVNYEKSVEISRKICGTDEEPSISKALNNIGNIYTKLGKYDEGLMNYNRSLEINRKIFSRDEHLDIAANLYCIGSVYTELGKYKEALFNLEKS